MRFFDSTASPLRIARLTSWPESSMSRYSEPMSSDVPPEMFLDFVRVCFSMLCPQIEEPRLANHRLPPAPISVGESALRHQGQGFLEVSNWRRGAERVYAVERPADAEKLRDHYAATPKSIACFSISKSTVTLRCDGWGLVPSTGGQATTISRNPRASHIIPK